MPKKKKPIVLSEIKEEEKLKYEIAEELGLLDRVLSDGWSSLSARETGRIGGMLRQRNQKQRNLDSPEVKM
ncbi:MAG: small, acid-soluble spore protein, alpha/beta type [Lachnospiraceae bacterium]|jgi:hypothetical protein|nr:small, acid-soluble spore protein, alpha/beta type [Lachnospiraceae bacterium]